MFAHKAHQAALSRAVAAGRHAIGGSTLSARPLIGHASIKTSPRSVSSTPSGSRSYSTASERLGHAARLSTGPVTIHAASLRRHFATSTPPNTSTFPSSFNPFNQTPLSLVPKPSDESADPKSQAKLACERESPLLCPNQPLVEELAVIYAHRRIGGDAAEQHTPHEEAMQRAHARAYERAIASVKAYPKVLRSRDEALMLPWIGPKISKQIGDFLETGKIAHAQELRQDDRLRACILFQTLHTVGPTVARSLYDDHGCRSLEDVYRALPGIRNQAGAWEDLQTPIPRAEVEEIAQTVAGAVEAVSPGCDYTICGGYRRGKELTGDVDIVFTHPTDAAAVSLAKLDAVVARLKADGIVTDSLTGGSAESQGRLFNQYLVVRLPEEKDGAKRLRRRVDIIFATMPIYWTAVLGWTGSSAFERDLRDHARKSGLTFDSAGIVSEKSGRRLVDIDPKAGEPGVFAQLGLQWIAPELRNADA